MGAQYGPANHKPMLAYRSMLHLLFKGIIHAKVPDLGENLCILDYFLVSYVVQEFHY